jgi:O-antigen/teichoic acid export membrane protein
MGILTFLSLSLVFISPLAIMVIATPEFFSAIHIIPMNVFALFWQGIYFMSVNPLFYLKKTHYVASVTITSAILNIGSNFILIPILAFLVQHMQLLFVSCILQ